MRVDLRKDFKTGNSMNFTLISCESYAELIEKWEEFHGRVQLDVELLYEQKNDWTFKYVFFYRSTLRTIAKITKIYKLNLSSISFWLCAAISCSLRSVILCISF